MTAAAKSEWLIPTGVIALSMASVVAFESPIDHNRARWPVWCGAYLLGSVFTLFWFAMLSGVLQSKRPIAVVEVPELELSMLAQAEVPPPPANPNQPSSKPATPKTREPPRPPEPLVAPSTNENPDFTLPATEPPPEAAPAKAEAAPTSVVETPVPAAPIKVEPLFRLTRLPDFGDATTLKYPAAEKNRGREGTVIAEFVIDEQGAVRDIKILKSAGALFDQAVIDELSKTTFRPSYIGERPVAARFRRPFEFKLH